MYRFASMVITIFLVSCMGGNQNDQVGHENSDVAEPVNRVTDPYEARTSINHKEELVFIYIDSPHIRQYNDTTLVKTVITLKNRVSEKADSLNMGFLAMGVPITWDMNEGYNHFSKFGTFDELLLGNSWFGTGGLKYVFEDFPGRPGVPQVLITKRIYDAVESENGEISNLMGVESEELLVRNIGDIILKAWLDDGVKIPEL